MVQAKLWSEEHKFYGNLYPQDQTPRVVLSYHTLEALKSFGAGSYAVSDLSCNIRREGKQSLVVGGSSLVILEGKGV